MSCFFWYKMTLTIINTWTLLSILSELPMLLHLLSEWRESIALWMVVLKLVHDYFYSLSGRSDLVEVAA